MTNRAAHLWDMGLLHRWWHAQPKDVAERFASHVRELGRDHGDYTVVALDCTGPTWRHQLFPAYKANRENTPERRAIREQIVIATEVFRSLGVKTVQVDSYEADDLLATLARRASAKGFAVVVHTGDKDMVQLMSDRVRIHDDRDWVTVATTVQRFGVLPVQLLDYLSMVGDSSDNIPGVKGMGPVAAKSILNDFPTVDAALERARWEKQWLEPKSQNKLLRKLLDGEAGALVARQLIALKNDVPIGG